MKSLLKYFSLPCLMILLLWSCKKDENRVISLSGTAPVLTASTTAPVLQFANADKRAILFTWTNPNYQFNTGVSSLDVSYQLEVDTTGANFSYSKKKVVTISKELKLDITVAEFNDYLVSQLQVRDSIPHNIEVRVKSSMGTGAEVLTSNVIKFTGVVPYRTPPKVTPPASGELYITGDAVASGWTNTPPAPQKFTKKSPTLYEITVNLIGGKSYTFLSTFSSWDDKYSIKIKNDPNTVYGGDFQWQGQDILAPPASGNYKIQLDFQIGKFTVTQQ
jgi:starch-binding outer membrane protein SusE/F